MSQSLTNLALVLTKMLAADPEKDKQYIAFLEKHKLPNSGPTPKLLESLTLEQRKELVKIIKP